MVYPNNLEEKLGFDKIRELLKAACVSTLGQSYVEKIKFSTKFDLVEKLVKQTAEFKDILVQEEGFPRQNYIDTHDYLSKAALEGAFLSEREFFELKISLVTIRECLQFFANKEEQAYPYLIELSHSVELDRNLIKRIDEVVDDRGKVRDTASPELNNIRRRIIVEQSNLRRRLDEILSSAKKDGLVKEDASLTLREGRMVIPVKAENKRRIKGFVHDQSSTGQTVYLEPAEIFDTNNEIRELEYRERDEVVRILMELTNEVRPHIGVLRRAYNYLGMIDFIRAKARFALDTQSVLPTMLQQPIVDWTDARHPLLYLSFKQQAKQVVPLTLLLNQEQKVLVVSGPNAGGKSVSLKTVGLLQYMFQSGLLVPMYENSRIGFFRDIFIDIGDEQSLENDLSTYSSHLTNMKHFLRHADERSLFLIDEFGTGTEPSLGAAIAEAILEKLDQSQASGVITTHYTNLKFYAENAPRIINGAMRFDVENLEPLYMLEMGKPGSSFAFEIARKIGLPREVIQRAQKKAGRKQVDFDKVLRDLEIEKKDFETKNQQLTQRNELLEKTTAHYQSLKEHLDNERKKIMNQAKEEAKRLVQQANQRIEETIRQIRENKAEKQATKELRKDLDSYKEEFKPEAVAEPVPEDEVVKVVGGKIDVGSLVRIKGQNTIGEVVEVKGKDVHMRIGDLKSKVKLNRLEKITRKEFRKQTQETGPSKIKGLDLTEKMAHFNSRLDLRGKRGDEALKIVEVFIDDAILVGTHEVQIVHGKGDGILRNLIRQRLKDFKEIESISDGHADRGGDGISVVRLK
ncbi:endonuclease MutS2 [Microscilla marina]|uniref:Endonuclease MutS2 n=1 Tax=Microscilla marina ATCC 23134 TaxID=313606 RepID=A1ZM14_MICM2|nr:endonuclease MutS2 [Microscilla marina]EAY28546.1 DNA mismatch repair protein MutS [Microscilla marina ATCC 23134]